MLQSLAKFLERIPLGRPLIHALRMHRARNRMDQPEVLHEFWRQPEPDGNEPTGYIVPIARSKGLVHLIADVPKNARILEIGCNVGRNLAYLYDQGWKNVEGVEISPHAVKLLRQTYPQLADQPVHLGPAEEVLPGLKGPYDLVFTMAVLEHIHPKSSVVFENMARLSREILTIEPESQSSHRQFPHDMRTLFAHRGFRLVSERPMRSIPGMENEEGLAVYIAWRWAKA